MAFWRIAVRGEDDGLPGAICDLGTQISIRADVRIGDIVYVYAWAPVHAIKAVGMVYAVEADELLSPKFSPVEGRSTWLAAGDEPSLDRAFVSWLWSESAREQTRPGLTAPVWCQEMDRERQRQVVRLLVDGEEEA